MNASKETAVRLINAFKAFENLKWNGVALPADVQESELFELISFGACDENLNAGNYSVLAKLENIANS